MMVSCKLETGIISRFTSSLQPVPAPLIVTRLSIVLWHTVQCGNYLSTVLVHILSSMTVYNLPGVLDTALVLDAIDYLLKLLYKNFGLDGFHFAEALLLYCLVFYSQFALCNLSFMQQNRLLYTSREHTVCTGVCRCIVENVKKKAVCEIACTCHLTSFVSLWVISGFASASEQDPCSHLTYKCVNVCRCCGVKQ